MIFEFLQQLVFFIGTDLLSSLFPNTFSLDHQTSILCIILVLQKKLTKFNIFSWKCDQRDFPNAVDQVSFFIYHGGLKYKLGIRMPFKYEWKRQLETLKWVLDKQLHNIDQQRPGNTLSKELILTPWLELFKPHLKQWF